MHGREPLACASAGNFGQALALAAARRNRPVHVFTASNADPFKVARLRRLGAEVNTTDEDFDGAKEQARQRANEEGWFFVEDGGDPRIAEGAGTIAAEMESPDRAARVVTEARALGLRARTGSPDDIGDADVICTCTSSVTPLFDGANLAPGVHINAIGSYQPERRELDDTTIRRCRLVVEDHSIAFLEAGDLAIPAAGRAGPVTPSPPGDERPCPAAGR
jgi:hypothetical protein